jgi:fructokinase
VSAVDLVCLGEFLIDMFPAEVGRRLVEVSAFRPKPGGAPANVAVAAARLGRRTAFIGKVGDEAFGHYLAEVLQGEGVETRGVRFDAEARTTMAFIALPDPNHAEFVFYRNPGADTRLRPDELDAELLGQARAAHFGSLSLTDEPGRSATFEAVRLARAGGALISFDANYRPSLWPGEAAARQQITALAAQAHLLKVNETECQLLTGSNDPEVASRELLELGPTLIVVTLGTQGSYFRLASGGERVPGFTVTTVDATGCGDAFIAGLLSQLTATAIRPDSLTAEILRPALRYASAVGAITALTQGVIPALPTAARVDEFLAQHAG